jgi:hypothetical protein
MVTSEEFAPFQDEKQPDSNVYCSKGNGRLQYSSARNATYACALPYVLLSAASGIQSKTFTQASAEAGVYPCRASPGEVGGNMVGTSVYL